MRHIFCRRLLLIVALAGDESWPLGCSLRFIGGTQMTSEERVLLPVLESGQSAQVRLSMVSPDGAGGHQCQWRPATLTGQFFGGTCLPALMGRI